MIYRMSDIKDRLRAAHEGSAQRIMGTDIFEAAADEIERLETRLNAYQNLEAACREWKPVYESLGNDEPDDPITWALKELDAQPPVSREAPDALRGTAEAVLHELRHGERTERDLAWMIEALAGALPCSVHEYDGAFKCFAHNRLWGAVPEPDEPCSMEAHE